MSKALTAWQDFQTELSQREREIASMLPKHISKDRFINSAIAAVKQTPGLLECTPRSLMAAVTKSAQDGLLPDGREGVINIYNTKVKGQRGEQDRWEKRAQWLPMVHGLRKRARELGDVLVSAQVVCENDEFTWEEGDNPKIEHRPTKLGSARGSIIGAYAIYRSGEDILHREVMGIEDIEAVRAQSKDPDSLMWKKFFGEATRKTVVRRGFKSVPCSEKLATILERDDDQFDYEERRQIQARETKQLEPPNPDQENQDGKDTVASDRTMGPQQAGGAAQGADDAPDPERGAPAVAQDTNLGGPESLEESAADELLPFTDSKRVASDWIASFPLADTAQDLRDFEESERVFDHIDAGHFDSRLATKIGDAYAEAMAKLPGEDMEPPNPEEE